MKRLIQKNKRKNSGSLTRNIINVIAIVVIATTAISWIGIMEVEKN